LSVSATSLARTLALRLSVVLAATCAFVLCAGAGSAAAASGYRVTYAARSCPSYEDIFANRARNDIQESLKDLGPDSPYSGSFLVNPDAEGQPPQDRCTPLVGWQFTLGTNYQSRAVSGPWGSLSKVTDPYDTFIKTKASTPLLNQNGDQIGDKTIAGAVTVELTSAQVEQASNSSQLWAQGGTPDDPVLAGPFPGPQYGFGALRCAIDALNGDNVEFIFFPSGVKHVFCYALYVTPPPTSGTITIQKRVTGAPAGENPSFPFNGSLSFDPNGFALSDGQSKDFVRAGGASWDVTEGAVDGYSVSSVQCSATSGGPGPPGSSWTVSGATTTISLVAGEHVTCVYTNQYGPPAGGLTITKITRGGAGTFGYVISGDGGSQHAQATTTKAGVPVDAQPSPLSLAPGTYTIREQRPQSADGRWRLDRVRCNGEIVTSRPVRVQITGGAASVCTFVNVFTPRGSISVSKVTYGNTGTAAFVISPQAGTPTRFLQHATTTKQGVTADAEPATPADATDHLRLGSYMIVEQSPPASVAGRWTLAAVLCNGVVQPFAQGAVTVRLTRQEPSVHCVFADSYSVTPPPDPPPVVPPTPPVNPPGGGGSPNPVYPTTDLAITKRVFPSTVVQGQAVTYRITVRNISNVTAQRVSGTDENVIRGKILSIHTTAGSCRILPRATCQVRNIKPGAKVVVTARVIPPFRAGGRFVNRVAVGSATHETNLANNTARTTVRVLRRSAPAVTG
jgi:hypothetical protein